jgi:hypothetical protein
MDINLSLSPATSITANYLVVAIYEATSPTVVADFQTFAAPHVASRNISFTNVNNVPHYVKVYENTTATVGGTVRHQFLYNPWFKNAIIRDDLFLIANTTTGFASNNNGGSYTDTSLAGWTWSLERRGFGTMQRTVDYSWDSGTNTWALLATLDNPTPNIQDGEIFVIHFQPQITTTNTPQSTSISLFSGVEIIDADTALDATIMGKAVQLAGATPFFTVTLPDLNLIQANRPLIFMSNEGSHVNASITAYAGQSIKWLNSTLTEVVVGQSEEIWLYKWVDPNDSSIMCWKVLHADGNFKTVGEIVDIYKDSGVLNALYCAGQSISKSSYKRLWNYVNGLDGSMLVSDANWSNVALNNKGKFADVDTNNFRLPQLYSTGFLKSVNSASRKAGSFEDLQALDHQHIQTIGTLPSSIYGQGPNLANKGNYDRVGAGVTDLTSKPCDSSGIILTKFGIDNRPANTGVYKLIRF